MKNLLIVVIALLGFNAFSQTEIPSEISSVKVYRQNAEITREVSVNLTGGTQEIVLTGISTFIIPSSLQVRFKGSGSTLLSAKYELNYLNSKKNNPEIEKLYKQLSDLNDELSWIADQKVILKGMEDILNSNRNLGGTTTGFTPAQVVELSNTYKAKLTEIKKEFIGLNKDEKRINETKNKVQGQLNEMNASINRPSGNIVLSIDSKSAVKADLKCVYNVSNAGWNPLYDLRSNGIEENVQLNYKANVYQNSGNDWKNVYVTVSTGNPLQDNNRPVLYPLYANIWEQMLYKGARSENISKQPAMANMAYAEGKDFDAFNYNATVVNTNLNIEFVVSNKQNVKSDGKENLLALQSYDLKTEYVYHSVPKLNKGAFLLAKVSDWGQYNLLSGNANIFFEGAFVGETQINPEVTADTLLISMGRDNGITVDRKEIKDFTSTNFIGQTKEVSIGYEITILNKKSKAINIEILDQIPVSQNEKIEITLNEKGSAEYTQGIGKLLWELTIPAGQSKKEKFIYTVKYPKKEKVTGIK